MTATAEAHNQTMNVKGNEFELAIISAFFLVLSLVGVVWTFTSGLIGSGIDGIMLALIGLMVAGIFALQLLFIASDLGMIKLPSLAGEKKAAPAAKAATPAAAAAKPAAPPTTTTEAK
jgi:bacteriorhodopsin